MVLCCMFLGRSYRNVKTYFSMQYCAVRFASHSDRRARTPRSPRECEFTLRRLYWLPHVHGVSCGSVWQPIFPKKLAVLWFRYGALLSPWPLPTSM